MDSGEFEGELKQAGFLDIETKKSPANFTSKPHSHPFDVRALVLDGEITLTKEGQPRTYRAGEIFEMDASCVHTEQYGPAGTTYLVGRRHPSG